MTAITAGPLSPPSCSYQGHASPRLLPAANPFPPDRELLLLVTGSGTPHLPNQNVLKISYSLRFFLPNLPSSFCFITWALATSLTFPKRHLPKTATSGQPPPFVSPLMVSWSNRLSAFVSVDPLGAWHLPGRNDFHLCSATARPAAFRSFSSILQQILSSNNSSVLARAVFRFFLHYFWAK